MNDFSVNKTDLKKLEQFFKDCPNLLRPVTANVLNSLAFDNRKLNLRNIENSMIIRKRKFVESSLQVQKAKSGKIEGQIAYSGSVKRQNFTGWEEQQEGRPPKTKRAITLSGRRGIKRNIAISRARLKSSNKFYKPSQFPGQDNKSKFMFMMRVLNSRGGGEFIIDKHTGRMKSGLYQLKRHKISMLQKFDITKGVYIPWASKSIQQQKFSTNISKKYEEGIKHIIARYK